MAAEQLGDQELVEVTSTFYSHAYMYIILSHSYSSTLGWSCGECVSLCSSTISVSVSYPH